MNQTKLSQQFRHFRHVTLAISVVAFLLSLAFVCKGIATIAPNQIGLITPLAVGLVVLGVYLGERFTRWLGYTRSLSTLFGGIFIALALNFIASVFLHMFDIEAIGVTTVLTIVNLAIGFWLVNRTIATTPTKKQPRIRHHWSVGRILTVAAPLLASIPIWLTSHINNVGMGGLGFVVAGIFLLFLTVIPAFFALFAYYHPFTIIAGSAVALTTILLAIHVVMAYFTALPASPLGALPEELVNLPAIASLGIVYFYIRDYAKIPKK